MLKYLNKVFVAVLIISMVTYLFPSTTFAATDDEADDIKYAMDSDETLNFDEDDFNEACDELTGEELDYVKFTIPDEDYGILYYNYDEDEDDNAKVSSSKRYYYSGSPYLSDVTFVPDEDYSDTLTIKYIGHDVDGNSYTGEIKITVNEGNPSIVTYSIDGTDEIVDFDEDDFSDVCDEIQNENLDYVKFTLPDDDDGVLYYDYDEDEDDNTKVSASKKYYFEDTSPYISKVTFVPADDLSGSVTIEYTGYDVNGDDYSAKIKITVGDDEDDGSSSSDELISYTVNDSDDIIDFDKKDFQDVSDENNNEDLDYITLTIPSATKGILYYNYTDGEYSSIISSGKKYYYDSSPFLSNITFVPNKDFKGTFKIDYKGYDVKGDFFSGIISITVGTSSQTANVITYSGKINSAVSFKDEDFNSVCKSLTSSQLSYVKFTLPASSYGTLYYGYTANGSYSSKAKTSTEYYYGGSPYLLNVSFVPADNFTGAVTISYTGYDKDNLSYPGKVQINISTSGSSTITPGGVTLIKSKYFKDVDEAYSWSVPYIDNLYESGIVSGSASANGTKLYSPASNVTRGDFMLILYKTLSLKTSSTTSNFADVPSGSYYYSAIITSKALGIVQGTENKFYPNNAITREDAMVMALRAVNITGKTISSGDISSLSKYSDGSSISEYSKSAVSALIKVGIITGSDDNKIYPQGNLTRAQVAAIIYRIKNL